MSELFILEHPSKGVITDVPGDRDDKYHYSWSGLRSDERTRVFNLNMARKHVEFCAPGTKILKMGTWEVVK